MHDNLETVVPAWLSILLGVLLMAAAFFVAKGYGLRHEEWMIRTIFRRDPNAGWTGKWRSGRFYRFWRVDVGAAFLAFMGILVFIGGIVRLVQGG